MTGQGRQTIVLGAGITGLTVAWELAKVRGGDVVVLEKEPTVGGLASTHRVNGYAFDVGSHRLHDSYAPEVARLVDELCGPDLLRRERRGLLFLQDRSLRYPPSPFDIMAAFSLGDFVRFTADLCFAKAAKLLRRGEPEDFEAYTVARVGRSLYERFYKPYAEKLYGRPPSTIAKDPAVSRVRKFSAGSFLRDVRKRLRREKSYYLYPVGGVGQLAAEALRRFQATGGRLVHVQRIHEVRPDSDGVIQEIAYTRADGVAETAAAAEVIATVPLDVLHQLVMPVPDAPPRPAFDLSWRGLRLLYLVTPDKVPSPHETFYFPDASVPFGRVSELNRYSPQLNPAAGQAVLTVEFPCSCGDSYWEMPDAELAALTVRELRRFGILRAEGQGAAECFSRKVKNVYPVYDLGWKERFEKVYGRLHAVRNLYLVGRGALFLHCNIDHCILMALKLAEHLASGESKEKWDETRQGFFDYRVRE